MNLENSSHLSTFWNFSKKLASSEISPKSLAWPYYFLLFIRIFSSEGNLAYQLDFLPFFSNFYIFRDSLVCNLCVKIFLRLSFLFLSQLHHPHCFLGNFLSMSKETTKSVLKRLDTSLKDDGHNVLGKDSAGGKYPTIWEMWLSQGVVSSGTNEEWYERDANYYKENCPETIDGILGGFASITDVDFVGSKRFLDSLQGTKHPLLKWSNGSTAKCGAGIGRVSKGLLLKLNVKQCDLIESSEGLLMASPDYIGDPDVSKCRFFCEGLQHWTPRKGSYTIIRIQWVLCYLASGSRCGWFFQTVRWGANRKRRDCVERKFMWWGNVCSR